MGSEPHRPIRSKMLRSAVALVKSKSVFPTAPNGAANLEPYVIQAPRLVHVGDPSATG